MEEQYQDFICSECGSINGCEHYNVEHLTTDVQETTIEELLISFVYTKPPLWDHTLPLMQRTKGIKEQLWLEVLNEFGDSEGITVELLQKKWKNLRDTYLKTKMDLDTYVPTGSAAKKKKKKVWKHYEAMRFLSNIVAPRAVKSSYEVKVASSLVSSPGTSNDSSMSECPPILDNAKRKLKSLKSDSTERAILEAIDKVSTTPGESINPICSRISEILSKMPAKDRYLLEVELLRKTMEVAEAYL